jgi:uncharacterized membrane-anchored protein
MSSLRFIVLCATVAGALLIYLLFAAFRLPANQALAFTLFSVSVIGIVAFAVRIAVKDKQHHHVD